MNEDSSPTENTQTQFGPFVLVGERPLGETDRRSFSTSSEKAKYLRIVWIGAVGISLTLVPYVIARASLGILPDGYVVVLLLFATIGGAVLSVSRALHYHGQARTLATTSNEDVAEIYEGELSSRQDLAAFSFKERRVLKLQALPGKKQRIEILRDSRYVFRSNGGPIDLVVQIDGADVTVSGRDAYSVSLPYSLRNPEFPTDIEVRKRHMTEEEKRELELIIRRLKAWGRARRRWTIPAWFVAVLVLGVIPSLRVKILSPLLLLLSLHVAFDLLGHWR
jgi:hypothetical protein